MREENDVVIKLVSDDVIVCNFRSRMVWLSTESCFSCLN